MTDSTLVPTPVSDFDAAHATALDALVIGAGPVGLFTVFQLGLQGVQAHLCDTLAEMGGQCIELYADKPIYDIPGIPLCTGRELAAQLQRQIAPFAPAFHPRTQVAQLQAHGDGRWRVQLQALDGQPARWLLVRTVFVTAGVGAFVPKQLRLDGADALLGSQLFYHPNLSDAWLTQVLAQQPTPQIVVHGGDEAAVQAAVLATQHPHLQSATVALLHRRDQFSAAPELLDALAALRANGRVQVVIGMPQTLETAASGALQAIAYIDAEGQDQRLPCNQLWVYQGISPKLGPLLEWGLAIEKKQLQVATDTFATSATGIYAAGDIVNYPGKRKLILSGFYEATMAAMAAIEYLRGEKLLLEYTTTSKRLHERLGVSHPD
ncbi:NAD(P)/FAD-dependent oxidoreductase [Comamonas sp. J-3]|uniref:NAD(P)/FAD-dependent oxidoreductase n=1 Tax=Comamonas trifloxystrobinivorans TaxID=3350256 RepID=UPI00372A14C1